MDSTPFLLHRALRLARAQLEAMREMDLDLLDELTEQRESLAPRLEAIPAGDPTASTLAQLLEVDGQLKELLRRRIRLEEKRLYQLSRPLAGGTADQGAP